MQAGLPPPGYELCDDSPMLKNATFLGLGILASLACGSGGSTQSEDGLRRRAESAFEVVSSERWAEFYASYFSPESQAACPGTTFALTAELAMTTIKALMGLGDSDILEFDVQSVTVNGDRGQVTTAFYVNGAQFGPESGDAEEWA
jgi:hypothetical protein